MKVLFLDQTGELGGAEFALLDVARAYGRDCLVGLFADGPFRELLEKNAVPVQVVAEREISVQKDSGVFQGLASITALYPLVRKVAELSRDYDVIYANTQKALVVGALASLLSKCPLAYQLHDILSDEHFSPFNCWLAVTLANRIASVVMPDSLATQAAFVKAGGNPNKSHVVFYGFDPELYEVPIATRLSLRQELGVEDKFVVGHFSRLSPWKGQHVLIDALKHCPEDIVVLLVGDAIFGENTYKDELRSQVQSLGLERRVHFLGFRSEVPQLMTACDLVTHTSTAPEPFGRVIVEAMLCGTPVIAANAGGAAEIVEHDLTGWLCEPGDSDHLAQTIRAAHADSALCQQFAKTAQAQAQGRFSLKQTNLQIHRLLEQVVG